MLNTNFPRFVFLLLLLFCNITLQSQSSRQATILYNGKEVTAELAADGSILKILDATADDLAGFTMKIEDYLAFLENNNTASTAADIQAQEDKTIFFENGFATLTDQAISDLDAFTRLYRSKPAASIVLRSLQKIGQNSISKSRINAIKTYLTLRGIQADSIKSKYLKGETDVNEIKIHMTILQDF